MSKELQGPHPREGYKPRIKTGKRGGHIDPLSGKGRKGGSSQENTMISNKVTGIVTRESGKPTTRINPLKG